MVAGDALRIVFFGTPEFAVPTLDALLASRHRLVGAVTQPDRPRGRGHKTSDAPVKSRALAAGLPILQPDRLKDPAFLDALAAFNADLGVVAAYGRILTDAVLATPRLGLINVHASLLPRYRGAAPVHRAVIAGERETGVTIMRVVKALDAGPMLATARCPIGPEETSEDVERDLARIGAALLVASMDELALGRATETPQDEAAATYAPRLTKDDGAIDWKWPADRIHNLIRGLHPWPHAYTFLRGARLIVRSSICHESDMSDSLQVEPGTIVEAAGDRLIVATGNGALHIREIQAEGKRPMTVRDFLPGHRLARGDRFTAAP
ncbi:MAG TPA: methionyl-tRNA formyltransferase [Vicinamibacterales bacterium]|jgi:methionyl-tRNA formyltransferase|nr:methionyl-tRNA formyltransferase [Vicinamibacterales bacterium]